MTKKYVTILEKLKPILEMNGETTECIEALLVGTAKHYTSERELYEDKKAILAALLVPYEEEKKKVGIPDFYAWTGNYIYLLHIKFNADFGDTFSDYKIFSIPKSPELMYPESVSL